MKPASPGPAWRVATLIGFFGASSLLACSSGVVVDEDATPSAGGGAGGTPPSPGGQGGTTTANGGAPSAPPTCNQVCANIPPGGCASSVDPSIRCHAQCERVRSAFAECGAATVAFLDCIIEHEACSDTATKCLPQLEAWTECSGQFCGGCLSGGNMAGSFVQCSCLGVPETYQFCNTAGSNPCDCELWGDSWQPTAQGLCEWPYER